MTTQLTEEEKKAKKAEYARRYYENNKEKVQARQKKWVEENKEKVYVS